MGSEFKPVGVPSRSDCVVARLVEQDWSDKHRSVRFQFRFPAQNTTLAYGDRFAEIFASISCARQAVRPPLPAPIWSLARDPLTLQATARLSGSHAVACRGRVEARLRPQTHLVFFQESGLLLDRLHRRPRLQLSSAATPLFRVILASRLEQKSQSLLALS